MTLPDLQHLLELRKLEQTCPICGRTEAAGPYCTRCFRQMKPEEWYLNGDLAQRQAHRPK